MSKIFSGVNEFAVDSQLHLAGLEEAALVVDGHPEVSALVVDGNVGGVAPVDDPVLINTWQSGCIEHTLVLPRAQRHQALHQYLQKINSNCLSFLKLNNLLLTGSSSCLSMCLLKSRQAWMMTAALAA